MSERLGDLWWRVRYWLPMRIRYWLMSGRSTGPRCPHCNRATRIRRDGPLFCRECMMSWRSRSRLAACRKRVVEWRRYVRNLPPER